MWVSPLLLTGSSDLTQIQIQAEPAPLKLTDESTSIEQYANKPAIIRLYVQTVRITMEENLPIYSETTWATTIKLRSRVPQFGQRNCKQEDGNCRSRWERKKSREKDEIKSKEDNGEWSGVKAICSFFYIPSSMTRFASPRRRHNDTQSPILCNTCRKCWVVWKHANPFDPK